nr:immunoglobulin light chain junction region [Macaca mulatta]MOY15178.1 immunoglobulin light chain junction region [Macaca mulatta]MOY15567.1 immunoglobulin light chain junction region [Macaca mulatta]MOY15583.1 immunoglobulin light chain junction region [Macaca mulatta]MOY15652.1 immunoglobulin light chain junction region [Macaca mulatta]
DYYCQSADDNYYDLF